MENMCIAKKLQKEEKEPRPPFISTQQTKSQHMYNNKQTKPHIMYTQEPGTGCLAHVQQQTNKTCTHKSQALDA